MDDALKKTIFDNHLKEDWRTVHNIWPNIGRTSGTMLVAANVTNTSTTMANVTGLTFSAEAGKTYGFQFTMHANSSASACAILWQLTGPGGATSLWFSLHDWGIGTYQEEEIAAFSTPSTAENHHTTLDIATIQGYLVNGNNSGSVQVQFKCETASNTVTAHRGSWGIWHRLD